MARFDAVFPSELLEGLTKLTKNEKKMLEEMTEAGAATVYENIVANVPKTWHNSNIMKCLKQTKPYKTPSDDGINTKVAFYGYFINRNGKKTPAPLVANVTEFGRSNKPKKPFLRKSFNEQEIEKAMLNVQKKYIKEGKV